MAIPEEAFVLFTTVILREKEMVIHTPPRLRPVSRLMAISLLTNGALAAVLALSGLHTEQRVVDPRRPHDPPIRLELSRTFLQPTTILSPLSPPLPGEASTRLAPPDIHVRVCRSHLG